jgi:hypothetical protein
MHSHGDGWHRYWQHVLAAHMKLFTILLIATGLMASDAKWGINRIHGYEVTLSKYNTNPFRGVKVHPEWPTQAQAYGVMLTLKWKAKPLLVFITVRQKLGNDLNFNYTFHEPPASGDYVTTVLFTPLEVESILAIDVAEVVLMKREEP